MSESAYWLVADDDAVAIDDLDAAAAQLARAIGAAPGEVDVRTVAFAHGQRDVEVTVVIRAPIARELDVPLPPTCGVWLRLPDSLGSAPCGCGKPSHEVEHP